MATAYHDLRFGAKRLNFWIFNRRLKGLWYHLCLRMTLNWSLKTRSFGGTRQQDLVAESFTCPYFVLSFEDLGSRQIFPDSWQRAPVATNVFSGGYSQSTKLKTNHRHMNVAGLHRTQEILPFVVSN